MRDRNPAVNPMRLSQKRGSIMSEMVFMAPIFLMLIIITLYNGFESTRITMTQVMLRYEADRDVKEVDGPMRNSTTGHEQLNAAFFNARAQELDVNRGDGYPMDVPERIIENTEDSQPETVADLQRAWFYIDGSSDRRFRQGVRVNAQVLHPNTLPYSELLNGAIERRYRRIDLDWRYEYSQFASPDTWEGIRHELPAGEDLSEEEEVMMELHIRNNGRLVTLQRAVRDVFLMELDTALDLLDGDNNPEYNRAGDRQIPNREHIAGVLRNIYLSQPAYVGPLVYEEEGSTE